MIGGETMHLKKKFRFVTLLILSSLIMTNITWGRTYSGKMTFGARSLALGGCSIGDKDNIGVLYSNPSALGLMNGDAIVSWSYNNKFGIKNFSEEQMAIVFRKWGPVRVGFAKIDNDASLYEVAGSNFWQDHRTIMGLGIEISPSFAVGASWQKVSLSLDVDNNQLTQDNNLLNIGLLYNYKNFSTGISISDIEILNEDKQFSRSYHLGISYKKGLFGYMLEYSYLDTPASTEKSGFVSLGVEADLAPGFALRLGGNNLRSGKLPNISIGIGASFKNISLDYAYIAPYLVNSSHQISTTYFF